MFGQPGEAVTRPDVFRSCRKVLHCGVKRPPLVSPILFFLLIARCGFGSMVSTRQTEEVLLQRSMEWFPSVAPARRPNVTSRDEGGRRPVDIRCYCNLPRCVSTGYMCKSTIGSCFSDFADQTELAVELATHGCIELLPSIRRSECQMPQKVAKTSLLHNLTNTVSYSNKIASKSDYNDLSANADGSNKQKNHVSLLLLCCHLDMCNHIDSPEIRQWLSNGSLYAGATSAVNPMGGGEEARVAASNQTIYFGNGQDGWFRVATIAVPICGAFILMLLIFLAFKILRTDSEEQKLRGQRNKQFYHTNADAWDEEDVCIHHHHCQTMGQLHSSDAPYSVENCQSSKCRKGHSQTYTQVAGTNLIDAKVHLLPHRLQRENLPVEKKSSNFDFLFIFPRGKSEKQVSGRLQQSSTPEGTDKIEACSEVIMASFDGRRDQL